MESFHTNLTCDYFVHMGWDKTIRSGRNDVDLQNLNVKYTYDAIRLANRLHAKKFVGLGSQSESEPYFRSSSPIY